MEPTTTKLLAALAAAFAGLLVIAPRSAPAGFPASTVASATSVYASSPPKSGRRMQWFHSHATARSLERRATRFGSTIVVGVDSMQEVASLRRSYGLDVVQTLPALRAAKVRLDASDLHALLAAAPTDPRIQVGVVDTGVDAVPDLAGKIDGLYQVTPRGTWRSGSTSGNDDYGHGTAVASLIAAGNSDGFGMAGFGGAAHVIGIQAGNE